MNNQDKEFFNTDFNSLGNIVNSVIQNTGLRSGMKKATVFKFWDKVVGKKFERYSRIDSLNSQNVLVVACANASVSSELLMFKSDILKKINTYANPLGIEIQDIIFSHKIWKTPVAQSAFNEEISNPHKPDLSGFNPDDIVLDESDVRAVRESVMNNTFASEKQREKMFGAIILNLKTQKYVAENKMSEKNS